MAYINDILLYVSIIHISWYYRITPPYCSSGSLITRALYLQPRFSQGHPFDAHKIWHLDGGDRYSKYLTTQLKYVWNIGKLESKVIPGTPTSGPPYGKLPMLFPYLQGFLWGWYGNSMGKRSHVLGGPWKSQWLKPGHPNYSDYQTFLEVWLTLPFFGRVDVTNDFG